MRIQLIRTALAILVLLPAGALAQTTEPQLTAEQRMRARYPQPARVGDLIGLPVLDDSARTLGYVREIVRTNQNKIELIVDYRGFLDWRSRPVAVPLAVVGIAGRQISSLDMPRSEYASAPTWQKTDTWALPLDATIRIALSRH
jgi:PRC-barrel domain